MVDKLEACTWCGHEGVLHCSSDGEVEWVRCVHCGRESPLAYSKAEAIQRWNAGEVRDAKPTPVNGEQVERMRDAIVAGMRGFCVDEPDFTMSRAMLTSAADHILSQPGLFSTPTEDARERVKVLEEALEVGDRFVRACFSAWSCGEPPHRVKTMLDRADEFQATLARALVNKETDRHG